MLSKPPHKSLKAIDNLRSTQQYSKWFRMISWLSSRTTASLRMPNRHLPHRIHNLKKPKACQANEILPKFTSSKSKSSQRDLRGWRKRCTIIAPNKVKVSRQHVCRRGPLAAYACVSLLLVFAVPGTNNLQIWRIIIPPVPTDSYAALNVTPGMIGGAHPIYGRITIRGSLQQNNQNHICYNWVY